MKKIVIMIMILTFGLTAIAMAGTGNFTGKLTTAFSKTTLIFSTSTNVHLGYNSDTNSYAAETKHNNGSRCFGGASNSTALMYLETATDCGPAVVYSGNPGQSDSSAFSTWSSL